MSDIGKYMFGLNLSEACRFNFDEIDEQLAGFEKRYIAMVNMIIKRKLHEPFFLFSEYVDTQEAKDEHDQSQRQE